MGLSLFHAGLETTDSVHVLETTPRMDASSVSPDEASWVHLAKNYPRANIAAKTLKIPAAGTHDSGISSAEGSRPDTPQPGNVKGLVGLGPAL